MALSDQLQKKIPYGYCECGCGQKTDVWLENHKLKGRVKGEPKRFVRYHHSKLLRIGIHVNPNPSGTCQCGCGQQTNIAVKTQLSAGIVKGYPQRFMYGHHIVSEKQRRGNPRHGQGGRKRSGAYRTWAGMMNRCYCKSSGEYENYGARGITVCDRWHRFESFLSDMGERPEAKERMTIDRVNGYGNYEPGNCRWATYKQQANNRRARAGGEVLR